MVGTRVGSRRFNNARVVLYVTSMAAYDVAWSNNHHFGLVTGLSLDSWIPMRHLESISSHMLRTQGSIDRRPLADGIAHKRRSVVPLQAGTKDATQDAGTGQVTPDQKNVWGIQSMASIVFGSFATVIEGELLRRNFCHPPPPL